MATAQQLIWRPRVCGRWVAFSSRMKGLSGHNLAWVLLSLAVWAVWQLPLRGVVVAGTYPHVPKSSLQKVLSEQVGRRWLSVSLPQVQQALEQLPWVAKAEVSRLWPGRLRVVLVEPKPWMRLGDQAVVDVQGHAFPVDRFYQADALPKLVLPKKGPRAVFWPKLLRLHGILSHHGLPVRCYAVDDAGVWSLVLDHHGVWVLGRHHQALRLSRFLASGHPYLCHRNVHLAGRWVDLRYPAGFAVGKKTGNLPLGC